MYIPLAGLCRGGNHPANKMAPNCMPDSEGSGSVRAQEGRVTQTADKRMGRRGARPGLKKAPTSGGSQPLARKHEPAARVRNMRVKAAATPPTVWCSPSSPTDKDQYQKGVTSMWRELGSNRRERAPDHRAPPKRGPGRGRRAAGGRAGDGARANSARAAAPRSRGGVRFGAACRGLLQRGTRQAWCP